MIDDVGIRELGAGRWEVRVPRVDTHTGKRVNRKATVRGTRADALRERDRIRVELTATSGSKRERMKLGVFAEAWLRRRGARLKPAIVRKYGYSLRHICSALGALWLDAIAPSHVDEYISARVAAGAAGNTVLNELRVLRTIASDCVSEGHSERNWCDRVQPPKVAEYSDENPNLLTPEQAAAMLLKVPPQWLGLVVFAITTGVRIGEATALRWDDLETGYARIRRGNDRGNETDVKNKSSRRTVPALAEVLALLGPRRPGELVFPTRSGGMHRGSPLRRVLDRACAAAAVPRVTAHGLRRTFNNEGRRLASREVLMSVTGHVTDEMVQHYSLVGADEKAELSRAIAVAFRVPTVSGDRTRDPNE